MIDAFAWFYVNVLENLGKVLLVLFALVVFLSIINFFRDPKAKANLINSFVAFIFQIAKTSLVWTGKVLRGSIIMLLNIIKVIFAAVRDFWTSKI
jgi:hypothetical protein